MGMLKPDGKRMNTFMVTSGVQSVCQRGAWYICPGSRYFSSSGWPSISGGFSSLKCGSPNTEMVIANELGSELGQP